MSIPGFVAEGDILPYRILPKVIDENEFFWTSGADGKLRFLRCQDCKYYIHPPSPICPECLSHDVAPEVVSGKATLYTWTVNVQPWIEGTDPYIIGIVEINEQEGLRLTTNVLDLAFEDLRLGIPLEVTFLHIEDVWLPLFKPPAP
jgi:uncharacterized OB-fold protein